MKVNFVKKLEKENTCIVRGQTEIGIDCYYHIRISPDKFDELSQIPPGTKLNITDFGEVIEKGYGDPP